MLTRRLFTSLALLTIVALLLPSGAYPSAAQSVDTGPRRRVIVDTDDLATIGKMEAAGAQRLVDYGAFALWSAPDGLAEAAGAPAPDEFDTIYLRGTRLNTASAQPAVAANLQQAISEAPQFWMVQFIGPVKDDWLTDLAGTGVQTVMYMPNNAYVVWGDGRSISALKSLAAQGKFVQWTGPYHPDYRLAPDLKEAALTRAASDPVDVTVEFYNAKGLDESLAALRTQAKKVYRGPVKVLDFTAISVQVEVGDLVALANESIVFNVEPWIAPRLLDEAQGQILAGNVVQSGQDVVPSGPGYLAWLASKGFPTDPNAYPVVDVVDDGIDNGDAAHPLHPDFHELGSPDKPSRLAYVGNCTAASNGAGPDGHGNLNAGIAGAYNNRTGFPYTDTLGYRIGLGISPFGRLAGTRVFGSDGKYDISACGADETDLVKTVYGEGGNLTSDSWGSPTKGGYDVSAQLYDALTRDAMPDTVGNQEMLHVFAAGNDGNRSSTVGSPGTAKNVLTVGATENVRAQGVFDGCNEFNGDNADDVADFSSRGPAADGRVKPDIMAPGTHIQGPASQPPDAFTGASVCGAAQNDGVAPGTDAYYPTGDQTLYTWSTGTSHSTPAIAGLASLIYEYYGRVLRPAHKPSPAMLKALMVNTPRYLTGVGANDSLPSYNQGWGDADLGAITDGVRRYLVDQSVTLSSTGQSYQVVGRVVAANKPFHVSLVWSDAPGSTTGNSYVNNLNLEVTIGGQVYRGNVFSGSNSVPGGQADPRNNVENIFIPAGVGGSFSVRVVAANIAGDGVPGNADQTDQDFALVVYNASIAPSVVLSFDKQTIDDSAGNGNGVVESGESGIQLNVTIRNDGNANATGVSGLLTSSTPGIRIVQNRSAYPDLVQDGGKGTNTTPFRFDVNAGVPCNSTINFTLVMSTTQGSYPVAFTVPVGSLLSKVYAATGLPISIPDNSSVGITSTIHITDTSLVAAISVTLSISHTWDADLDAFLESPDGIWVALFSKVGSSGDDFANTVFDDTAATPIQAGSAPFTGRFRPTSSLGVLTGRPAAGDWKLHIFDHSSGDVGRLRAWKISIGSPLCTISVPILMTAGYRVDDSGGNANGVVDPGETGVGLTVGLRNTGQLRASKVSAVLSTDIPGVRITQNRSAYPDIVQQNGTVTNTTPFRFDVPANANCGTILHFTLVVSATEGVFHQQVDVPVGVLLSSQYGSGDVPKNIPDNDSQGITSTLGIPGSRAIADVNVNLTIQHTYDADLDVYLESPAGTLVELFTDVGAEGDGFTNTTLDDQALRSIADGSAPFTGVYRPEGRLADFNGEDRQGTWKLHVYDDAASDTGRLISWSVIVSSWRCGNIVEEPTPTFTPTATVTHTPSPTTTITPTPTGGGDCSQNPPPTPEPLWVDPVVSPTSLLTQTLRIYLGRGRDLVVTSESGFVTASGNFSSNTPTEVTIQLLPNTTHHISVLGRVEYRSGCFYYLHTNQDRFGNPLIIVQQGGHLPTATPSPTAVRISRYLPMIVR